VTEERWGANRRPGFSLRVAFIGILVLLGYYLGARIGIALTFAPHPVSPEKLSRRFDSFYTTKKDGMGLGVPLPARSSRRNRGRIWVENNPVGGATFHFTVPVAKL
jgi:K+-sensing histidine kinase KdpD